MKRAEVLFRQLEQRWSQGAFSERKVAAVEGRVAELDALSAIVERRLAAIAERESVVAAVRREVEAVDQISAQSREDLKVLASQREDVVRLRKQVQKLLDTAKDTDAKIAAIELRRRTVDEVQTKAGMIVNLLSAVRVNLDSLTEQRAVVEQVAGIQFASQEATGVLRALQQEREMAQRIATGLQQLRARTQQNDEPDRGSGVA